MPKLRKKAIRYIWTEGQKYGPILIIEKSASLLKIMEMEQCIS